jgi:hypothetical protein
MSSLCGAGALAREKPAAERRHSMFETILVAMIRSFKLAIAVLKEIFDESAYQRFLNRSRLQSSSQAYAMFLQENEQAKSRRPRCC